jgi:hypothetical protein
MGGKYYSKNVAESQKKYYINNSETFKMKNKIAYDKQYSDPILLEKLRKRQLGYYYTRKEIAAFMRILLD